jgi:site-specific recombinase XerD
LAGSNGRTRATPAKGNFLVAAIIVLQTKADQQPWRKRALLVVLIKTGMQISETVRVTMDQFDGNCIRNVIGKGWVAMMSKSHRKPEQV